MSDQTEMTDATPKCAACEVSYSQMQKLLRDEVRDLQENLTGRFEEIAVLTARLETMAGEQDRLRAETVAAMQNRFDVEQMLAAFLRAGWDSVQNRDAPPFEEQLAVLSGSDLFQADWYLNHYPDLADAGVAAADHYLRIGAYEGRWAGPEFDSKGYYLANPDVAEAGWPALVHFEMFGKSEGRPRDLPD
ncbi:MAG: hypothetical protein WBC93_22470 [Sulfitobacter sp.]